MCVVLFDCRITYCSPVQAAEGSSATEPTMTTQEKRRFHLWKELWKETISSSEDYFRYLTQRVSVSSHNVFSIMLDYLLAVLCFALGLKVQIEA